MGIDFLVRGSASNKTSAHHAMHENRDPEDDKPSSSIRQPSAKPEENARVSFLKVPDSPLRRPSTADVVIQRLQVERVEGGGLSISGVALAANCHFTLLIFGTLFLLAGLVLSYVGFASKGQPEGGVAQAAGAPDGTFKKTHNHKQVQVIGPIFLVVGLLMLLLGISMYALGRKVRHDEKAHRATVSAMQLSQLENSFIRAHTIANNSPLHTTAPQANEAHPILSLRRGSLWIEPTPIEDPGGIPRDIQAGFPRNSRSPSPHFDHFPVSFDPMGDPSGRRFSSSFSNASQVFEVQEFADNQQNLVSSPELPVDSLPATPTQCSKTLQSDISELEKRTTRCSFQIPQIQVTPSSLETLSGMSGTLPLSKNGVALPRLSRHSIGTRGDT